MPVAGSQWFDNSANANKLRNSYLKGFLDISGGGISIRNATGNNAGTALNFYDDATNVAKVRMDADKIRVAAPLYNFTTTWSDVSTGVDTVNGGEQIDISMQAIGYLSGISRNIERSLQHLHDIVDAGEQTFGDVSANTVAVAADATIGGRLYVNGDINGNGNLSIAKNAYIGGDLTVAGNSTVQADFYVKGNTHLDGDVYLKDDLHLYSGNIYAYKNLTASGDIFAGEDLYVKQTLNVTSDASLNSLLFVSGDVSFNTNLRVGGDISANGTIFCNRIVIVSDLSDNGSMEVATDLEVSGTAFINGDVSLNSTLNVAKAAVLSSTLSVADAATLSSTLSVAKAATLSSTLDVAGDASFNKIIVHGDASLNSTLNLAGVATFKDALSVAKAVTLSSTLNVSEDALFNKHIGAFDISAGKFQTGKLVMEDKYDGINYENYIRSTAGDISIRAGDGSAYGNIIIKSNLIVDGSINFSGTITQTDIKIQISDQLDISANDVNYESLKVIQHASTGSVATFYNQVNSSSVPVFVVGYNFVAVNKTINAANYELDVSGNIQASAGLKVGGAVTFLDNLTVTGDYASTNGNLTLTNGKITAATMEVTTTSLFGGKVTMNGGLDMAAATFINQLGTEVW